MMNWLIWNTKSGKESAFSLSLFQLYSSWNKLGVYMQNYVMKGESKILVFFPLKFKVLDCFLIKDVNLPNSI